MIFISKFQLITQDLLQCYPQAQAQQMGLDGKSLLTMSKSEMALRSDNDQSIFKNWKKKSKGGKVSERFPWELLKSIRFQFFRHKLICEASY